MFIHLLTSGIHFMDFVELDDGIHELSWDNSEPKPIVINDSFVEIDRVVINPLTSTPIQSDS